METPLGRNAVTIARPFSSAACMRALSFAVLVLCAASLGGCGKTGYPAAPDKARTFAWQETRAEPAGKCIAFTGSFSGAYRHFDGIRLELQALDGLEDCPGCPFTPDEAVEFPPRETGFNPDDGTIAFSYCPKTPAPVYRWIMAARSEYSRMPHVAMLADRLLVLDEAPGESGAPAPERRP